VINTDASPCIQMHPRQRPPEQKAEALRLVAEVGTQEAARRTGIPFGTVSSWARRSGVHSPNAATIAVAVEVAAVRWAERRVILGEELGRAAGLATRRMTERLEADKTTGVRDLAATVAVLVDKAQLLTGGATARTETAPPQRTPEIEQELAKVIELRTA